MPFWAPSHSLHNHTRPLFLFFFPSNKTTLSAPFQNPPKERTVTPKKKAIRKKIYLNFSHRFESPDSKRVKSIERELNDHDDAVLSPPPPQSYNNRICRGVSRKGRVALFVDGMEEMRGALGTVWSMGLRLGQAVFAVASVLFMCLGVDFYSYTAFCFLVAIMGLVIPWSLTSGLVDVLSIYIKRPVHPPGILSIVLVGDWVLSYLSLAALCSTASVTDFLLASGDSFCAGKLCTRYQMAAFMAFLSWSLLLASSVINLRYLASM